MRRWVAWSSLLTLLVMTGCSSDGPKVEKVGGIPVLEGATKPPGTKLANGFTVPPGTVLIGDVFPVLESQPLRVAPNAWRAHLLVLGDPREVAQHFQREAERIGLAVGVSCGMLMYGGYGCWTIASAIGPPSRSLIVRVFRQNTGSHLASLAPMSHASIDYSMTAEVRSDDPRLGKVDLGPPPPPLAQNWPPPPEPGAKVPGHAYRHPVKTLPTVESGSRVVAPWFGDFGCVYGDPDVMLRLDGDPEKVVRRYQRQFGQRLGEWAASHPFVRRVRGAGVVVLLTSSDDGADSNLKLTAFVREGQPTWAVLETCLR
jgi:hypothetical protein